MRRLLIKAQPSSRANPPVEEHMSATGASLQLRTCRLELVAATPELLHAHLADPAQLGRLLGAHVPKIRPAHLDGGEAIRSMGDRLREDPHQVGWWSWYFVRWDEITGGRTLIGDGGFKGPPAADGSVEIGYSVLARFRNQGYATEAVKALLMWAFEHAQVKRVVAEALAENQASMRVLDKAGFTAIGEGSEKGLVRFEAVNPCTSIDTQACG